MASRCGNKVFTLLDVVLVLSFLMISVTESALFAPGPGQQPKTLTCKSLYGAQQGETCFNIIQKLKLDKDVFTSINPNLNCSAIFIGQWLCVDGNVVN